MKVQIVGKALVITSSLKTKDIKRAKNICPKALQLCDDKDNVLFTLDVTGNKNSGIGQFGVNLDSETSGGLAQVTLVMDKELTKEQLADNYGLAFIRMAEVESQFTAEFTAKATELARVIDGVEGVE